MALVPDADADPCPLTSEHDPDPDAGSDPDPDPLKPATADGYEGDGECGRTNKEEVTEVSLLVRKNQPHGHCFFPTRVVPHVLLKPQL